ncbi:uncharacterized protein M6B38_131920 [Iris pallida]|uniref:Uncharacterized protein n=1 Tax=Iris pallida TaxID=29817 RepID=A0AAX6FR40_IRIPA|nr:uncharacterized protein M6B38_131920 [Iris pallida]
MVRFQKVLKPMLDVRNPIQPDTTQYLLWKFFRFASLFKNQDFDDSSLYFYSQESKFYL